MSQLGRIEQWNDDKGYGFVRPLESQTTDGNAARWRGIARHAAVGLFQQIERRFQPEQLDRACPDPPPDPKAERAAIESLCPREIGNVEVHDQSRGRGHHQVPVFGIDAQGSCGGFGPFSCSSSIEMPSGVFTNAM